MGDREIRKRIGEGKLVVRLFDDDCVQANLSIALYPGMKICQFSFVQMTGPAQFPYGHKKLKSHYLNQKGATGSNTRSIWGRR